MALVNPSMPFVCVVTNVFMAHVERDLLSPVIPLGGILRMEYFLVNEKILKDYPENHITLIL